MTPNRLIELVNLNNLVFVDVEATGRSPWSGIMTEFGAVHYTSRETFHGVLVDSEPSKENPAIPSIILGGTEYDAEKVMSEFVQWLGNLTAHRPVFVSDNPAYDFQWINYYTDKYLGLNPFGYSGRRIGDFWAGYKNDFGEAQSWKQLRKTKHDHNPVNDAMGNVEAFEEILRRIKNEA